MLRILKKALLVFLIGWVPLQASAYSLSDLLCERDSSAVHGHSHHGHAGDPAAEQDDHGDADSGSSPVPLHDCYYKLTSATMPSAPVAFAPGAAGVEPAPLFHLFSFFPDHPKRPPLAA
jgi:hypothetical protein